MNILQCANCDRSWTGETEIPPAVEGWVSIYIHNHYRHGWFHTCPKCVVGLMKAREKELQKARDTIHAYR